MNMLAVFIGGTIGALLRHIILCFFKFYPWNIVGVFLINILGCFFIGFISYLSIKKYKLIDKKLKNLLSVGFAGGFTTFSAFCYPMIDLFAKNQYFFVLLIIFFSIIIGLIFVSWGMNCGYYLMNFLIRYKYIRYSQNKRGEHA